MTTQQTDPFEAQLREQLRESGWDAPDLQLDPATVLGAGNRMVRRRRIITATSALAAVTAIALGSYAVLTGGATRAADLSPATSSPSQLADAGVVTAALTFDSFIDGTSESGAWTAGPLMIDLSLDTTVAGGDNLTWSATTDESAGVAHEGSARVDLTTAVVRIPIPEALTVLTVEPVSTWMNAVQAYAPASDWGGSTAADTVLGGTGLEARAFRFATEEGMAAVTGFIRADASGAVLDDLGDAVESATSADGSQTFYWSDRLDTFGQVGDEGSSSTWISARAAGERVVLATGRGGIDGAPWTNTVAFVADAGATDPVLLPGVPDAGEVIAEAIPLGTSRTVIAATYETTGEPSLGNAVVTWTDADGVEHSYWTQAALVRVGAGSVHLAAEIAERGRVQATGTSIDVEGTEPTQAISIALGPAAPYAWSRLGSGVILGVFRDEPSTVGFEVEGAPTDSVTADIAKVEGADLWLVVGSAPAMSGVATVTGVTWLDPSGAEQRADLSMFP